MCLELLVNEGANCHVQGHDGKTALHMTAFHGRFSRAQTLIQHGALIDHADKEGNTPLHIAARYGHELLVETLLNYGADPKRRNGSGMYPVHLASLQGYLDCVNKLLSNMEGVQIDAPDDFNRTCLHAAACGGNEDVVELLLAREADHSLTDCEGKTPLHYAAGDVHYRCVVSLVTAGAEINILDNRGCTPLHYAAASDIDAKVVEHLLGNDANPCQLDHQGYSALHYAALNGHKLTLEMILDVGARELLTQEDFGSIVSPLHLAAYNGHLDALNILTCYINNLDMKDDRGQTALHLAASQGFSSCCEALLSQGANVMVADSVTKATPLHVAANNGHSDCLRVLLQHIKDARDIVDCRDEAEKTPLMMAVAGGHIMAALLLLNMGANVNAVDIYRRTALHRGTANGHEECVEALLRNEADVLVRDINGRTSVHMAAMCGHVGLLGILLQKVEKDNLLDNKDYHPLHWACYNSHESCVELLLDIDPRKEFVGNPFSPLHCAAINGNDICTESLLESRGPAIANLRDGKGRTPCHAAAYHNHCESLQLLLNNSSEVDSRDDRGRTPLMFAAMNGQCGSLELLLDNGAELCASDNEKNMALHHACINKHDSVALLLLDKIEDSDVVNSANAELKTPLHWAAGNGMVSTVQLLLEKGSSILARDENGYTPALSCAANSRVAECLAMILCRLIPQSSIGLLKCPGQINSNTVTLGGWCHMKCSLPHTLIT
ncbi:hypothetical protein NP493_1584g00026 [Ridgeia piscesae]|uniref:Serine/threonine-protein phosphatase 6 regulatory ankyrin repeat subunit A n=1 Tax=Ridgeia piscesae TaxID=27915 RepID=A0AAD9JZS5_RIDPI|nr:hypothetical protein NP493_1584g00026 [Ridgeia piscesae]